MSIRAQKPIRNVHCGQLFGDGGYSAKLFEWVGGVTTDESWAKEDDLG